MRCQACFRKVSNPQWVGRYSYGPVCFSRMFPSPKRVKREKVAVKADDLTGDLFDPASPYFEPCFFDSMGAADRANMKLSLEAINV